MGELMSKRLRGFAFVILCMTVSLCGCRRTGNESKETFGNESTDNSGKKTETVPGTTEDGMTVLEEGRFYLLPVADTAICNEFFSMEVPQEMAGKVSCILEVDTNEGNSSLKTVAFFLDELAEGYTPTAAAGSYFELVDTGMGWLGSIFWDDLTNYEEEGILEDLILSSSTTDISKMNFCYNMLIAPAGRSVVTANEEGTGAYFLIEPSDVQYTMELEQAYYACSAALHESTDTFCPVEYPLEKGYSELYQEGFLPPEPSLDSDVLVNFKAAETAYAWFTGYHEIGVLYKDQYTVAAENGTKIVYAATNYIDFGTMEELQIYLSCFFPESTVSRLLDTKLPGTELPVFREKDGVLYAATGYVGQTSYDDYEAEYCIIDHENSGGTKTATLFMLCHVNIQEEEAVEQLEYTMIFGPDNHWRVTEDFELPIERLAAEASGGAR